MNSRILIVDDEESHLDMLARLLGEHQYDIVLAQNGEEALDLATRIEVDLVITDLRMPGMGGFKLAEALLERDQDLPVIAMTAFADLDSAKQALALGVYDYLTKPVDIVDMLAAVKRGIERRRLLIERHNYHRDLELRVKEQTLDLRHKVEDLEARDRILSSLLSSYESERTFDVCISCAVTLTEADEGTLYVFDAEEWKAVATIRNEEVVDISSLSDFSTEEVEEGLAHIVDTGDFWVTQNVGKTRQGRGVHSLCLMPAMKSGQIIGCIELARSRPNVLLSELEAKRVASFASYIAMVIYEATLQDRLPSIWGNLEDIAAEANAWQEIENSKGYEL